MYTWALHTYTGSNLNIQQDGSLGCKYKDFITKAELNYLTKRKAVNDLTSQSGQSEKYIADSEVMCFRAGFQNPNRAFLSKVQWKFILKDGSLQEKAPLPKSFFPFQRKIK